MGRGRYWTLCAALLLATIVFAPAARASLFAAQLTVSADPVRVAADGKSSVAITIEVLDLAGRPAPDGTAVNLVTTLGEIVSPVQTIGGVAQTVLTPSNAAGTALVSAMVGAARATVEVEFVAGPGSALPGSPMVELSAEELSYSPDRKLFVAGPKARLTHETVEIRADGMEYDVMMNVVRAQGSVVLRCGGQELQVDALFYDLSSLRGRLLRVGSGEPERLLVEGEKLATRADPSKDPALWYPVPAPEGRTWLKARTAAIHPGERVILDHAAVYVDDLRVMGMRRHVMDPRQGPALFGNTFGYSSLLGAALDIPYYYRASGNQIGSLHFTHNGAVGGLGGAPGWAVGLKEEYIRKGHSEGCVSVEDITHPGRDVEWQHQLKLGAGSALSLDAATSTFQDGGPQLRAAGLSYYRPMSSGRLSLALSGSDFGTSENSFASLAYRFKTRALASGVLLTPVVSIRHSRRHSETEQILVDPDTGETLEIAQEDSGHTTSPGFDMDIDFPGRAIAEKTNLSASMHTGYAWGLDGGARSVFDGRLGIVRQLAPGGYIRLEYSYSGAPASLQPTLFSVGRQRLSLNGRMKYRGCDVRLNASQEIGGDRTFANVGVFRGLPWGRDANGHPLWTLQANHIVTHFSEYKLASSRLSLARRMGQYRLALCFSPQGTGGFESQPWISLDGYGYTYSGGRHLWIEVSAATF